MSKSCKIITPRFETPIWKPSFQILTWCRGRDLNLTGSVHLVDFSEKISQDFSALQVFAPQPSSLSPHDFAAPNFALTTCVGVLFLTGTVPQLDFLFILWIQENLNRASSPRDAFFRKKAAPPSAQLSLCSICAEGGT